MAAGSRAPSAATAVAVGTGLVFLFPAAYLLVETVGLGGNLFDELTRSATLGPLARSLLIASTTALTCAFVGVGLAIVVARTDLPGRRWVRLVLALPLVIPSFVGATAFLAAFGPGGLVSAVPRPSGFWGALLVLTLLTYPYVYLPVLARLQTTSPLVEDAARQLGRTPLRIAVGVIFPQVRGAAAAGTMLVFLYALSDFGAVSLMRYDTITRAIFSARLFDRATSLTLGLLLAILALAAAAAERWLSRDAAVPDIDGRKLTTYSLGRFRVAASAGVFAVIGVALVAPIAVFVVWVTRGSATVGIGFSGLGDDMGFLLEPSLNSVVAAVSAGLIAALTLLPLAYIAVRRRTRLTDAAAAAVSSVFALPGLVVALAFVFWVVNAPGALGALYQSFPLLVLAYVLHFGAQSLRSTQAAIAAVPERYDDAARMLGVAARRRFREIELPLLAPGLITGGGLVMLSTLKELPATLLLAPIGFQTLATRIWGAAEDGFYAEVGITSLLLIAVSAVLTWLLVLRPAFAATRTSGG